MKKNTNIFEKITQISNYYGFTSINSFALNGLGYKSSEKINRLRNPAKKPSFDIIKDISNKFVDVDLNWLVGEDTTTFVETLKRNVQKKRPFERVAKRVAESVQNETYKKSDPFKEDIVSELAAPYGISRNNNNYVITLLEENKNLVEEKNAYLEKENKRLTGKVAKLSEANAKLTKENKHLSLQIANLQAQNKERLSNQQPLKKEVST